jgi:hypothetical protein
VRSGSDHAQEEQAQKAYGQGFYASLPCEHR